MVAPGLHNQLCHRSVPRQAQSSQQTVEVATALQKNIPRFNPGLGSGVKLQIGRHLANAGHVTVCEHIQQSGAIRPLAIFEGQTHNPPVAVGILCQRQCHFANPKLTQHQLAGQQCLDKIDFQGNPVDRHCRLRSAITRHLQVKRGDTGLKPLPVTQQLPGFNLHGELFREKKVDLRAVVVEVNNGLATEGYQ